MEFSAQVEFKVRLHYIVVLTFKGQIRFLDKGYVSGEKFWIKDDTKVMSGKSKQRIQGEVDLYSRENFCMGNLERMLRQAEKGMTSY